jgi:multidrug transporter EmrE-like cation transporter
MMYPSLALFSILAAVVYGVGGQMTLKIGMTRVGTIGAEAMAAPIELALRVFLTPLVILGLSCYALGAVVWLVVLSRLPLSLAYPSRAISYVVAALLATTLVDDHVSAPRWLGIATTRAGIVLISRS